MNGEESGQQPAAISLGKVTAIILCGGRGERLRPLTDETPKPLLCVNGRPLLSYLLEHLFSQGIRDFILGTGHKSDLFEEFAKQPPFDSWSIRCQNTGETSIAMRLAAAREFIGQRALICYADTLADVDLAELNRVHESKNAEATITTKPYRSAYGIVSCDDADFVTRFEEKPQLPYWINIGFILCERVALQKLQPDVDFPRFLECLARERKLAVHRHSGTHWTANTEKEFRELSTHLNNGPYEKL